LAQIPGGTFADRLILGAAVLDDILALMVLAVVRGLASDRFNTPEFVLLVIECIAFVVFLTWMGPRIAQSSKRWLDRFKIPETPFVVSVILCLGLAELAHVIGLAALIGAFMAGIVIDELAGVYELEHQFKYLKEFLSPFFFVMMGAQLDPLVFLRSDLALLTILITVVAVLSKMAGSALGCWKESWRVKLQTGICMVPR
jgi:Kef-type K+ transport system membrane component KefB